MVDTAHNGQDSNAESKAESFTKLLKQQLRDNKLVLPTLPEVALSVRDVVDREDAPASKLAATVQTDAALAARLIQVSNSPLYRGRHEVENVKMAVTRLGNAQVRHLVTSLVMQQVFQASSDTLDARLRALWEHSVQVAGICRSLAVRVPGLNADQAMLAGLIHDIGHLPILVLADEVPELADDADTIDMLVERLHPEIGRMIMDAWSFPEVLSPVPSEHENIFRDAGPAPDYVDVVIVANLQSHFGTDHYLAGVNWGEVPAFRKLGLDADIQVVEIEGVAEEIEELESLLLS